MKSVDELNLADVAESAGLAETDLVIIEGIAENTGLTSAVACDLLQFVGPGIMVSDATGHIVYANMQTARLLGRPIHQLLRKSIVDVLVEADFDSADGAPARSPGTDSRFVVQLQSRRSGSESLEIRVAPLPDHVAGKGAELYEIYDVSDTLRHTRKLLHEATHDPLTGLANRRALTERLAECARWESERGAESVVAMLDLDGFKQINDILGHIAGDEVLQEIARLLQANTRRADMAVRLGGDEFVVVLIDCGVQEAAAILNDIKEQVDAYRYVADGREFRLTVSIGIACIDGTGMNVAEILTRADRACYQAKYAGGNRIVIDSAEFRPLAAGGAERVIEGSNRPAG